MEKLSDILKSKHEDFIIIIIITVKYIGEKNSTGKEKSHQRCSYTENPAIFFVLWGGKRLKT